MLFLLLVEYQHEGYTGGYVGTKNTDFDDYSDINYEDYGLFVANKIKSN